MQKLLPALVQSLVTWDMPMHMWSCPARQWGSHRSQARLHSLWRSLGDLYAPEMLDVLEGARGHSCHCAEPYNEQVHLVLLSSPGDGGDVCTSSLLARAAALLCIICLMLFIPSRERNHFQAAFVLCIYWQTAIKKAL